MHCVYERREVNNNTIGRLQWMGSGNAIVGGLQVHKARDLSNV